MVFNKLRKGEKRSLGNLRSPRASIDANADTGYSIGGPGYGYGSGSGSPPLPELPSVATQTHPTVVNANYGSGSPINISNNNANSTNNLSSSYPDDQATRLDRLREEANRRAAGAQSATYEQSVSPINIPISTSPGRSRPSSPQSRSPTIGSNPNNANVANSGWYMTTGVLPATVVGDDSAARSRKYDSIYRATGLNNSNNNVIEGDPALVSRNNTSSRRTEQSMPRTSPPASPVSPTAGAGPRSFRNTQPASPRVVQGTTPSGPRAPSSTAARSPVLTPAPNLTGPRQQQQQQQLPIRQEPRSRFTEQMDMVGRTSEDNPDAFRRPQDQQLDPISDSRLSPGRPQGRDTPGRVPILIPAERGDSLPASQIAEQRALASSNQRGETNTRSGAILPDERGEDLTASQIQEQRALQGEGEAEPTPASGDDLDEDMGYTTPMEEMEPDEATGPGPAASVTAKGNQLSPIREASTPAAAYPTPLFEKDFRHLVPMMGSAGSGNVGLGSGGPAGPRGMRTTPSPEKPQPARSRDVDGIDPATAAAAASVPQTGSPAINNNNNSNNSTTSVTRTPTQGPELETSQTNPSTRVISTLSSRYLSDPLPSMSFTGPDHPSHHQHGSLAITNVAQKIPHYMFVTYSAEVCQQCIASDQKMYSLQHGGEEWRYTYADPIEEGEIPSDDPNTTKTGRREYEDRVSLVQMTNNQRGIGLIQAEGEGGDGGREWEKNESSRKNRELVRFAAENGLLEEIFEGIRHPLSEIIETITYTTIIRAPIIEETITTVWCEDRDCPECQAKTKEFEMMELKTLMENYPGMVLHQTDGSDRYDAQDIWGLQGAVDEISQGDSDRATGEIEGNSTSRMKVLLNRAGNPQMEQKRSNLVTTIEGREIGEAELVDFDMNDRVDSLRRY